MVDIQKNDEIQAEEEKKAEIKPDPDYEFRKLAMDLMQEWKQYSSGTDKDIASREAMKRRVRELVEHNLTHNAEIEACDLLKELEMIDMLLELTVLPHLDYERICLYLLRSQTNTFFTWYFLIKSTKNIKLRPIYAGSRKYAYYFGCEGSLLEVRQGGRGPSLCDEDERDQRHRADLQRLCW